jgi:hypothetical protein
MLLRRRAADLQGNRRNINDIISTGNWKSTENALPKEVLGYIISISDGLHFEAGSGGSGGSGGSACC